MCPSVGRNGGRVLTQQVGADVPIREKGGEHTSWLEVSTRRAKTERISPVLVSCPKWGLVGAGRDGQKGSEIAGMCSSASVCGGKCAHRLGGGADVLTPKAGGHTPDRGEHTAAKSERTSPVLVSRPKTGVGQPAWTARKGPQWPGMCPSVSRTGHMCPPGKRGSGHTLVQGEGKGGAEAVSASYGVRLPACFSVPSSARPGAFSDPSACR